ncbi:MAG: ribonuclease III [Myxococcota bacterium]
MSEPDRTPGSEAELASLEEALGYRFRDRGRLADALRHSSYAHEHPGLPSNERLEFLGDAVVGLAVAHLLHAAHPEWSEGDLTRALHALVDKTALAELARELGLGGHLALGQTERQSAGEAKATILADAMEAVLGAMYLDGGLEPVQQLVQRSFAEALSPGAPRVERDPKTHFQELVMQSRGEFPSYHLLSDSGVEGDEDRFECEVRVQGEPWARARARSKRQAEKRAAREALPRAQAEAADG